MTECTIPATQSVPDRVPRSRRMGRTQSTYNVPGLVNGTSQGPPADSVNGPNSHRITNGTGPALGIKTKKVTSNKGTQSYKSRTRNSGTKGVAPAAVNGNSLVGEHALNSSSSASTIVVQSNKKTVVENGCPSAARPKSRRRRKGLGYKKRSTFFPLPVDTTTWPMPPPEDEDWEKEIQEVVLVDWEKRSFGLQPYGPEDLISFALRDVSLHLKPPSIPPITPQYTPERSHAEPVIWSSCYWAPLVEGQFSDVDE